MAKLTKDQQCSPIMTNPYTCAPIKLHSMHKMFIPSTKFNLVPLNSMQKTHVTNGAPYKYVTIVLHLFDTNWVNPPFVDKVFHKSNQNFPEKTNLQVTELCQHLIHGLFEHVIFWRLNFVFQFVLNLCESGFSMDSGTFWK